MHLVVPRKEEVDFLIASVAGDVKVRLFLTSPRTLSTKLMPPAIKELGNHRELFNESIIIDNFVYCEKMFKKKIGGSGN